MKRYVSAIAMAVLFLPSMSSAALTLVMTRDELRNGKAVLSGDLEPQLSGGSISLVARTANNNLPAHWQLELSLTKTDNSAGLPDYTVLVSQARHVSNPPPDPLDEGSPGPRLGTAVFSDLAGFSNEPPRSQTLRASHDGHPDTLLIELFDLNGGAAGVLGGLEREVRMNFTFTHNPEPTSLSTFLAVGWAARRRRS